MTSQHHWSTGAPRLCVALGPAPARAGPAYIYSSKHIFGLCIILSCISSKKYSNLFDTYFPCITAVTVGLGHGVYRQLFTLIGGQRAEKFENHCAKECHKKLLDSAESLVTNFQLKSAIRSEVPLKNRCFLTWETYKVKQYTNFSPCIRFQ